MLEISSDNLKPQPGVYIIVSPSKKIYVGETQNIKKRFQEHRQLLRKQNHYNKFLQHSYNKYRKLNFLVLEYCEAGKRTKELEKEWYDTFVKCRKEMMNLAIPDGNFIGTFPKGIYNWNFKDLTGQTINGFRVIEFLEFKNHLSYWLCICPVCGKKCKKNVSHIRRDKSCGCLAIKGYRGKIVGEWKLDELFLKKGKRGKNKYLGECLYCGFKKIDRVDHFNTRPHICNGLRKDYRDQRVGDWNIDKEFFQREKGKHTKYLGRCIHCGFEKIARIDHFKISHKCKVETDA